MAELVRRGDIWWLDWPAGRGSEQGGTRPGLIVQNDIGNEAAPTTIVAAIPSRGRRLPVIVPLSAAETGLIADSFVHLGQIMTVEQSRLVRRLGHANTLVMEQVDRALKVSFGLTQ